MKIKTEIFKKEADGLLHFMGDGDCVAYKPESKNNDHVTLAIGDIRLHLNSTDFKRFCSKFLYNGSEERDELHLLG